MWAFYVAFIALTAYFTWQLPPEWRDPKHPDIILLAVTLLGFSSLILLITCFHRIPNGWFRQAILFTESAYFSLLAFTAAICMFRQITYYPLHLRALKRKTVNRLIRLFDNRRLFMHVVMTCTVLFCAVGFFQMEQLETTPYTITIDKPCEDEQLRVALLADIHVGTGACAAQLDRMVTAVNAMDADVIILAGDIADSSSSQEDLAYLCQSLGKLESTYGSFYAEGNHEAQCHYEFLPGLKEAGVTVLHDSGLVLPNGLAIVGRCDDRKTAVADIRSQCSISEEAPCLVIQHRPQKMKKLAGTADLYLCGHTHGYQFPMCSLYFPALFDPVEGCRTIGDTQVITTTGVGAWGFHCSWPSKCEVAQIDISFEGGDRHETSCA